MDDSPGSVIADRWLLLIHQLPAKPAYLRVKIWRRLQALGAVAVKNAVYALPAGGDAQEDFEWLLREITAGGGEAMICEARLIDGLADHQVRALFDQARNADYDALAKEARGVAAALQKGGQASDAKAPLARLKERLAQVATIDFFGADGREAVDGLLAGIVAKLSEGEAMPKQRSAVAGAARDLIRRVWVTRQGVHVDRIASAWLIRRFIDAEARFKFVAAKGHQPAPGELRFDMFEAEFTHEGDRCTFEVLLERVGLGGDAALKAIGEIVHDIDLKDAKYARPEAEGIRTLIAGICLATRDDGERLARGAAVLDDLYGFFAKRRS